MSESYTGRMEEEIFVRSDPIETRPAGSTSLKPIPQKDTKPQGCFNCGAPEHRIAECTSMCKKCKRKYPKEKDHLPKDCPHRK